MTWLSIVLVIALVAALVWAFDLRKQLQAERSYFIPAPPKSELQASDLSAEDDFPPLFHAAAAALDDGILAVNRDRKVRFINLLASDMLQIEQQGALGQSLIALLRDYQADKLVRDVLADGEVRESNLQLNNGARTLRLRCAPLHLDDQLAGVLVLIRDMTQINRLERARRDMVANVSHELRTPLASLKLLVETLQSEPPPQIAQRMLGLAAEEVDAVTQLVDELHELSQIESGRVTMQLSPVSVDDVVERALARIRPQVERKSIRLSSHGPTDLPHGLLDSDRIGQVLLNLLHNAVKFTPEQGAISINTALIRVAPDRPKEIEVLRAEADQLMPQRAPINLPAGQWLLFEVKDSGIGIPEQDLQRIFERFYKVDRARTRNQGGTGLGLAIAKHLVEGHGGRLWATSTEAKGSSFFFSLPVLEED